MSRRLGLEALVIVVFGFLALLLRSSSNETLTGVVSLIMLFPAFLVQYPWLLVIGLSSEVLPGEPSAGVALLLMYVPIGILQGLVWVMVGRMVSMSRGGRRNVKLRATFAAEKS